MSKVTCVGCKNTFSWWYYILCTGLYQATKSKQPYNPRRCGVCGQPKF